MNLIRCDALRYHQYFKLSTMFSRNEYDNSNHFLSMKSSREDLWAKIAANVALIFKDEKILRRIFVRAINISYVIGSPSANNIMYTSYSMRP